MQQEWLQPELNAYWILTTEELSLLEGRERNNFLGFAIMNTCVSAVHNHVGTKDDDRGRWLRADSENALPQEVAPELLEMVRPKWIWDSFCMSRLARS